MKRDLVIAGVIWVAITALVLVALQDIDIYPIAASEEAVSIDAAFQLLLLLGTPVFTFVVVGLLYSVLRYRNRGEPTQDGPAIQSNRLVTIPWLLITSGLAIYVIFNPGLVGIRELTANPNSDLVVEIVAEKWQWDYTYPDYGVTLTDADELVLPVHRRVKFEISSRDIIHSFWIPAFRLKVDAVPGLVTELLATPTLVGTFRQDGNMRVQCAELCGTGHARMRTGLRVVEPEAFEAWVEENHSEGQ